MGILIFIFYFLQRIKERLFRVQSLLSAVQNKGVSNAVNCEVGSFITTLIVSTIASVTASIIASVIISVTLSIIASVIISVTVSVIASVIILVTVSIIASAVVSVTMSNIASDIIRPTKIHSAAETKAHRHKRNQSIVFSMLQSELKTGVHSMSKYLINY